jgi:phosphatidylglycerophosphate synthase
VSHWNRTYGGFIDAVCDKAFIVPCWIAFLHMVPQSGHLRIVQYFTLIFLILAEVSSGCIRFRAYYTAVGVPAPSVEGFDFSSSAVKADHVGKAKQTFEMVGSALFILPITRYIGVILLASALPLAYESVRRKVNSRVMYVDGSKFEKLDHKVLKFLMQAKAMGSKLIVGFSSKTDMILTTCACSCVDEVIAEAPKKIDLMFLEKQGIDYVISSVGDEQFVTDETLGTNRCLAIAEDGVARQLKSKEEKKE